MQDKNTTIKKALIAFSILIIALFGAGYFLVTGENQSITNSKQPSKEGLYENIDSTTLQKMLLNKDFFFVNVHIPYEGEIEKTDVFIPYDKISDNLDKFPKDKMAKIVLYCRSGRMSKIAAEKLTALGYKNVYNLIAGMNDWQSKGYPLINK